MRASGMARAGKAALREIVLARVAEQTSHTSITALAVRVPPRTAASVNMHCCTPSAGRVKHGATDNSDRERRLCGGKLELLYQTGRPTVAELLRMPPSMELRVETGPVQLHLPISAFL